MLFLGNICQTCATYLKNSKTNNNKTEIIPSHLGKDYNRVFIVTLIPNKTKILKQ